MVQAVTTSAEGLGLFFIIYRLQNHTTLQLKNKTYTSQWVFQSYYFGEPFFWFQKYLGLAFNTHDRFLWLYLAVANTNYLQVGVIFKKQLGHSELRLIRWGNQCYFGVKTKVLVIVKVGVSWADPKTIWKVILEVLRIKAMLVSNKVYATKVTTLKSLMWIHSRPCICTRFIFAVNHWLKTVFSACGWESVGAGGRLYTSFYAILHKGPEHPWVLVSVGRGFLEPIWQ